MQKSALKLGFIVSSILAAVIFLEIFPAQAEQTRVKFPIDVDKLVHYATVRRGEVTEHLKTSQEAIDAIKNKKPIPNGTTVALVDYRGGKVYRYFIMQKGADWGKDYDERRRTGDWQYQFYWGDRSVNLKENTSRCMSCHQSQKDYDYLYTADRIPAFKGTPVE